MNDNQEVDQLWYPHANAARIVGGPNVISDDFTPNVYNPVFPVNHEYVDPRNSNSFSPVEVYKIPPISVEHGLDRDYGSDHSEYDNALKLYHPDVVSIVSKFNNAMNVSHDVCASFDIVDDESQDPHFSDTPEIGYDTSKYTGTTTPQSGDRNRRLSTDIEDDDREGHTPRLTQRYGDHPAHPSRQEEDVPIEIPTEQPSQTEEDQASNRLDELLHAGISKQLSQSVVTDASNLTQAINYQAKLITELWPHATSQAEQVAPDFVKMYMKIKAFNLPNFVGARIEVPSDLVHDEFERRLADYHDKELCLFLKFGWPLGYHSRVIPTSVQSNHPSATAHMDHVERFIQKELQHKAVVGPFPQLPFHPWVRISPLMTREKRDSDERRIILDLSFPPQQSVNDGINIQSHFGKNITYTLPCIADLISRLKDQGEGALIWKADLTRAYRQMRADPIDTPLLGMEVNGSYFLDLCPPFGCRSSAALCQRLANALTYMMGKLGYTIIAYLDDFAACYKDQTTAARSYKAFIGLTKSLGLKLAKHKSSPPTTQTEWLGYAVDTQMMRIAIPTEKLQQVLEECKRWINRTKANKQMVQSLVGRLLYVANCVTPARKFVTRVLATLRAMDDGAWTTISPQFKADVAWFLQYATIANGIFLFNPVRPVLEVECDSSLFGGGGMARPYCYTWQYPDHHMLRYPNIHHLGAINILVAYLTLAKPRAPTPARIIIWTDNSASAYALTSGRTKDHILGACARQLWLYASTASHEIKIRHKMGYEIPVADALSRMTKDENKARYANKAILDFHLQVLNPVLNDYVFFHPDL